MELPLREQGAKLLHSAHHELCIVHHAVPIGIQCRYNGVGLSRRLEVALGIEEGEQLALVGFSIAVDVDCSELLQLLRLKHLEVL